MASRLRLRAALAALMLCAAPAPALAGEEQKKDVDEIRRQVDALTGEIEKLKLGAVADPSYESFSGLGPAASKVYEVGKGLSLGGYGELIYQNFRSSSVKDQADALRLVLYAGYKFNDWIVMNTELEFEHAGIGNVGGSSSGVSPSVSNSRNSEVYVEFSYLDFLLSEKFNVRTGLMLIPVGLANEYHEPTVYNGVLRPDVELNLIPSTWREMGVMAHGKVSGLSYKAGLVNGLRADRFSSGTWIRNGRQQGAGVNADAGAVVASVNYEPAQGMAAGGSVYAGMADHGKGKDTDPLGSDEKQADVMLWEAHATYNRGGLGLKALYAEGTLEGNAAFEAAPPDGAGKKAQGWYIEGGYDIMKVFRPESSMSVTPFARYEAYDTNKEVFTGTADPKLDRTVITAGVGFKPSPNVVIKADYQWRDTASGLPAGKGTGFDENKVDQVNLGVGFIF